METVSRFLALRILECELTSQATTICHYCGDTVSPNVICDDIHCPLKREKNDRVISTTNSEINANKTTKLLHSTTSAISSDATESNHAKE